MVPFYGTMEARPQERKVNNISFAKKKGEEKEEKTKRCSSMTGHSNERGKAQSPMGKA